ncbi:DUF1396 domain-containing protein [Streptomyces sp. NPDC051135]|uniref:DUF1396 domain-containing protein n=1 Tax=unclassified Streptomyces TaxID=2593676 RepID=UPI00342FA192
MRTSVRVPVGAGLAALLLAAGAVGCSKGDGSESPRMTPAAAVAKAAKNADDIDSIRYRMTGKVPENGRVEAEARTRIKPTFAMSMKMTAPDQGAAGTAEFRLVDKAVYIGGGPEAAKEMDGKSWIKIDLSELGMDEKVNKLIGASQAADKNPATESTFLTWSKDVEKVGTETVEGVKTTHYKGTVALADLEKSIGDEDEVVREERQKSLDRYEKMGADKLVMDMWVDGDDQTKQFRMRADADKGPLDLTFTFFGVNEPVEVAAPPVAEVADLAEMRKGAQQG